MLLVDRDIRTFLTNGSMEDSEQTAIKNGSEQCVTNIGYDLCSQTFIYKGKLVEVCELNPGESAFVQSKEIVHFDSQTVGKVSLKNSRIRMGFSLDSPVYQPGHTTNIYYRLTNITANALSLRAGEKYAMLMFEQLEAAPDHPYEGTFENEFSFSGLGNYESQYSDQIKLLDEKIDDLKSLEKSIYGNVLAILSVFVAIFTILNINITFASTAASGVTFLAFNLATIGAVSFLSLFMTTLLNKESKPPLHLWVIPALCFVAVAGIIFSMPVI